MSRSFKKSPWVCDRDPVTKRLHNRRFRRTADMDFADGNSYRRYSNSYDICDFKWMTDDKKWLRK